jgi:hypothetical protein
MKTVFAMIAVLFGSQAFADGFVCENLQQGIRVKVFNHTQAEDGTRNAAIMVVSDLTVKNGRKTIATFEDSDSLLTNDGATYTSKVDLRFSGSDRKGELLLGTKLGEVKFMILDIDYSYAAPVEDGAIVDGEFILKQRDGEVIRTNVICIRYLKGE